MIKSWLLLLLVCASLLLCTVDSACFPRLSRIESLVGYWNFDQPDPLAAPNSAMYDPTATFSVPTYLPCTTPAPFPVWTSSPHTF